MLAARNQWPCTLGVLSPPPPRGACTRHILGVHPLAIVMKMPTQSLVLSSFDDQNQERNRLSNRDNMRICLKISSSLYAVARPSVVCLSVCNACAPYSAG